MEQHSSPKHGCGSPVAFSVCAVVVVGVVVVGVGAVEAFFCNAKHHAVDVRFPFCFVSYWFCLRLFFICCCLVCCYLLLFCSVV
jgi:hypothetical protein